MVDQVRFARGEGRGQLAEFLLIVVRFGPAPDAHGGRIAALQPVVGVQQVEVVILAVAQYGHVA